MARFDISTYQTVDERIHLFWAEHPNGKISNEIVYTHVNESTGMLDQVIIRADVWRDKTSGEPDATDYAEETLGSSNVNKTSFVENCSTSSTGRALATLGMSKVGARPSREEMQKAERVTAPAVVVTQDLIDAATSRDELLALWAMTTDPELKASIEGAAQTLKGGGDQ